MNLAGCNIQTLRYYESRGLLQAPERTVSGYREYPPEAVQILRFIKRARELGFTHDDIEELLKLPVAQPRNRRDVFAEAIGNGTSLRSILPVHQVFA